MKNILLFIVLLGFSLTLPRFEAAAAKEQGQGVAFEDRFISSTLKILAKAFINAADFETVKKKNLDRMRGMSDEQFNRSYAYQLAVLQDSPLLMKKFGASFPIDRGEAEGIVSRLNKKKTCEALDDIPDEVLAKYFRIYLDRRMAAVKDKNLAQKVQLVWERVKAKME